MRVGGWQKPRAAWSAHVAIANLREAHHVRIETVLIVVRHVVQNQLAGRANISTAAGGEIAHVPVAGAPALKVGDAITAAIDWDKRYARMRMHTALHLLSAVLPYAVTGGSVGDSESRLDFDIPEAGLDKDAITAKVAEMIASNAPVGSRWITDAELDANPGLVKTMSVKPPTGTGRVRLIEISGLDLQPCGGTHVRATGEIGAVRVTQIEKKGKQNRRVRLALA